MLKERNGNWIETFTGVQFYPFDPREDEINITDIAHALSLQCRFNGHCKIFYSVGEHCIRVSKIVPAEYKLGALLHDAGEAYLSDIPRPIKKFFSEWEKIEAKIMHVLFKKYGIQYDYHHKIIGNADNIIGMTEVRDIMPHKVRYEYDEKPLNEKIHPIRPDLVEEGFLTLFKEYSNGR